MATRKLWILGVAAVVIDLVVYASFGLMLMGYDDANDGTEPDYYKWPSYTPLDKAAVIGLWFWNIVNILFWGYVVYRVVKRWRSVTAQPKSIS
jgi:hypothetical protein